MHCPIIILTTNQAEYNDWNQPTCRQWKKIFRHWHWREIDWQDSNWASEWQNVKCRSRSWSVAAALSNQMCPATTAARHTQKTSTVTTINILQQHIHYTNSTLLQTPPSPPGKSLREKCLPFWLFLLLTVYGMILSNIHTKKWHSVASFILQLTCFI